MKILALTHEDTEELAHLNAPLGRPGSGYVRYAAAMHFHGKGVLSDAQLEAYRICAKDDRADPALVVGSSG